MPTRTATITIVVAPSSRLPNTRRSSVDTVLSDRCAGILAGREMLVNRR
jgi:hypothetical protein